MAKLWDKGSSKGKGTNKETAKAVEKFTVGNDYLLDKQLVCADALTTAAHAMMLKKIGILDKNELKKLKKELKKIFNLGTKDKFEISQKDEDVHTAIENHLTKTVGKAGKKIHTGKSRNDQVLTDTKLYTKYMLLKIEKELIDFANTLQKLAKKEQFTVMPGYTHMQKAMPSSIGLWAAGFLESTLNDYETINFAYTQNDSCPLGSAAGYGVNLPLDREYAAKLLGFKKIDNAVTYPQISRGKTELNTLNALNNIMLTINKLATDLSIFTMSEFDYFKVPDGFTTGSSIMPQKKNQDVCELIKGKSAVMQGYIAQLNSLYLNLMSGYNRNMQLVKEPLINGLSLCLETLSITNMLMKKIKVNKESLTKAMTPELFAADYANELVKQGATFRDAYKVVGKNLDTLKAIDPVKNIKSKKSTGMTGNLKLNKAKSAINKMKLDHNKKNKSFSGAINKLLA
ncbi:argininosuccinate lyase [Nanoarchaeota archaeon]